MGFLYYNTPNKGREKDYPSWKDGKPNLQTYLTALNQSQLIIQSQYELVWSRWPRTIFFAKSATIPGVTAYTNEINHAGFTVSIPCHVKYDGTEVSFQILADKEGYHYYDIRNMVLQSGHPLIAGDTRAAIGNNFGLSPDEDTIDVKLRNRPEDGTCHHWIIHNFRPTKIGDVELSQDGTSFVEFELTGVFTHITYDCIGNQEKASQNPPSDNPFAQALAMEEGAAPPSQDTNPFAEALALEEGQTPATPATPSAPQQNPQVQQAQQMEQQNSSNQIQEDEHGELSDQDDRKAAELVQEYGPNDPQLQAKMEEHIRQQNPNSDPEMIQTRAELALDNARKSRARNADDDGTQPTSSPRFSLVMCRDKGELVGNDGKAIDCEFMKELVKAARDNHSIVDVDKAKIVTSPSQEFDQQDENYMLAKSSLPMRFGMYRPSKSVEKIDYSMEIEDPGELSTNGKIDPNHKFRSIF